MESLIQFETPSTCVVIGSTGSGKTTYVKEVIKQAGGMFKKAPKRIIYCYSVWQPLFTTMKETIDTIQFHEGLPTRGELDQWHMEEPDQKLLILDDLMQKGAKSDDVVDIFCQYSHHLNFTVWFICQNAFNATKQFRTISLNAHYFILFKNQRDEMQVQTLGRQIFPGQVSYFMSAYRKATEEKYNPLVIDLSPHSDPQYKLRTHIFPGQLPIIYRPERKS